MSSGSDSDPFAALNEAQAEADASDFPIVRVGAEIHHVTESRCTTCQSPIWWALTEAGKRMPMRPGPAPDGQWVIGDWARDTRAPIVRHHDPLLDRVRERTTSLPRYRPHWADCPDADQHRKKKR